MRRAEAGEEFEVTVDGRPSARLVSMHPPGPRTWVPVADVLAMVDSVDFAAAFAGERPDMGDAPTPDDDPFVRYPGWLDA